MKNKPVEIRPANEDWTLFLIVCLLIVAMLSSCNKQETQPHPKVLYSRTWPVGSSEATPFIIDVEGSFTKDTNIFIDNEHGSVEFKYH